MKQNEKRDETKWNETKNKCILRLRVSDKKTQQQQQSDALCRTQSIKVFRFGICFCVFRCLSSNFPVLTKQHRSCSTAPSRSTYDAHAHTISLFVSSSFYSSFIARCRLLYISQFSCNCQWARLFIQTLFVDFILDEIGIICTYIHTMYS